MSKAHGQSHVASPVSRGTANLDAAHRGAEVQAGQDFHPDFGNLPCFGATSPLQPPLAAVFHNALYFDAWQDSLQAFPQAPAQNGLITRAYDGV